MLVPQRLLQRRNEWLARRFAYPQGSGDGMGDQRGLADGRERHTIDAIAIALRHLPCEVERQASLARARRPHQRQQVVVLQKVRNRPQCSGAPDEAGGFSREVVAL